MLRGMLRNKRQSIFPPGWNVGFNQEIWTVFSPSSPPFFFYFLSVFLKKIQICDLCVSLSEEFQTEKHILFKKYFLTSSYCLISCHVPISRHHCLTLPSWPLPISNNILSFTVCRVNTLKPSFLKACAHVFSTMSHSCEAKQTSVDEACDRRGWWACESVICPPEQLQAWISQGASLCQHGTMTHLLMIVAYLEMYHLNLFESLTYFYPHVLLLKWRDILIDWALATPFNLNELHNVSLHLLVSYTYLLKTKCFIHYLCCKLSWSPHPTPPTAHVISACLVTVARYEAVKSHQSDLAWHLTIWHLWLFCVSFKIQLLVMVWWAVSSGITSHRQTQIGRIYQFGSCGDM